jgi:hypothetical protein
MATTDLPEDYKTSIRVVIAYKEVVAIDISGRFRPRQLG